MSRVVLTVAVLIAIAFVVDVTFLLAVDAQARSEFGTALHVDDGPRP